MTVTGHALLGGIVGDPITHSLSPRLHGFWLTEHAIDGLYVPLKVSRESFSEVVHGLCLAGFTGLNVTVPHKEAAFAIAHRLDVPAIAAGAVNLLLFGKNGEMMGRNTDAEGLAASLIESLGADALQGRAIAILGAGGAARAAVIATDMLGASDIHIFARHSSRANALTAHIRPHVAATLHEHLWGEWHLLRDTVLLVNATSAGLDGTAMPDVSLDALPMQAAVCDIVYRPLETELLKLARARGHTTVDGLGMLLHQAVPAFEALYGIRPTVTGELRVALEQALA